MDNTSDLNNMDIYDEETRSSSVWPYVLMGSAIGGAVGYLFVTDSGRKVRRAITHPDELADNVETARDFVEQKAKLVTDQVHGLLDRAKRSIEEGQYAYQEAGQSFRRRVRQIESKNTEITSNVHQAVDNMSRTAVSVEQSVLDPICEMGALYRGIERGVRTLFGKGSDRLIPDRAGMQEHTTVQDSPIPIRDQRVVG